MQCNAELVLCTFVLFCFGADGRVDRSGPHRLRLIDVGKLVHMIMIMIMTMTMHMHTSVATVGIRCDVQSASHLNQHEAAEQRASLRRRHVKGDRMLIIKITLRHGPRRYGPRRPIIDERVVIIETGGCVAGAQPSRTPGG